MSLQGFRKGSQTFLNGDTGPFTDGQLATLDANGNAVVCGLEGTPVGVADGAIAVGAYGAFRPLDGRVRVFSSASVTAGQLVKADSGGLVIKGDTGTAVVPNAFVIGQAETTVSGAGSLFIVCR